MTVTDGQPLPPTPTRRRASQPAPTPSTATTLIRLKRTLAACTGVVLALIGIGIASQNYGQAGADHAYLAGIACIVCSVMIMVGALGVDSQLALSIRMDELADRIHDLDVRNRAFEARVTRRLERIADGERVLAEALGDELNPRRR